MGSICKAVLVEVFHIQLYLDIMDSWVSEFWL